MRGRIREATIEAILGAAEEVFADAGLHAARMDTIAAKAGVSVGTLYNHFEDRDALVVGLMAARRGELVGKIDAALRAAEAAPLRERLRGVLGAFVDHCQSHRKFLSIVLQHEIGRHQKSFPRAWAKEHEKKHDTMQAIQERIDSEMKRGVKEGTLRPDLGDLGGTFFLGMLRALIIRDLVVEAPGGAMALTVDRLLDAFFEGMGPKADVAGPKPEGRRPR